MPELVRSLPAILKALQRGKVTPQKALLHAHKADKNVRRIFDHVHDKDERYELNLYVVGEEDEPEPDDCERRRPSPAERSPNQ